MTKIEDIRNRTYDDAVRLLSTNGRAAVIRPTGFGKSWMNVRFVKEGKYRKVLYMYPAEVVRDAALHAFYGEDIPEERTIEGVDFITNASFARMTDEDLKNLNDYDLFIIDECHKIGGDKTSDNLDKLIELCPDLKILGATATPERLDAVDVVGRYFDDNQCFEYNLHNAFQDGILKKPYYIYCKYVRPGDNRAFLRSKWRSELDKIDDISVRDKLIMADELEKKTIEISNLYNMDRMIRKYCDMYVDTSYMKFIVFFSNFEGLHKHGKKVKKWFSKAYTEYEINILEITSETQETAANVGRLDSLKYKEGRIDLIYAVDMLSMGYHVDNLTGILMYRTTVSNIVYVQQLGRALSTGSDNAAIVFDCVDNLHNSSIFEVLGKESIFTKAARERKEQLEEKKLTWDKYTKYIEENPDKAGDDDAKLFFGGDSVENAKFSKLDQSELNALTRRFNQPTKRSSQSIRQEDLIAIDIEAGYTEMIRKLVGEPVAYRANLALQNYLEAGGRQAYEDGRPFTSKEDYLKMQAPENIPIFPFCKAKRVTVDDVMDFIFKEGDAKNDA